MKAYMYNPTDGSFLREVEVQESPLERGKFLIPAFSTTTPPPKLNPLESAVFRENVWAKVPAKFFGRAWDIFSGAEYTGDLSGIDLGKNNLTVEQPPNTLCYQKLLFDAKNNCWIVLEDEAKKLTFDRSFLEAFVTKALNDKAKEFYYDDIVSAISYVGDPNPKYSKEGKAFRSWRSAVWKFCNAYLDNAVNEKRLPSKEQLLDLLPKFVL